MFLRSSPVSKYPDRPRGGFYRASGLVHYAKKPFGGPQTAIQYLARYTHRVALSNNRVLSFSQGRVTFRWKDYRGKDRHKIRTMTLEAEEFIRRFLIHILPPGFQRIRYFGLMASRNRKQSITLCRQLLTTAADQMLPSIAQCQAAQRALQIREPSHCPQCRTGILIRVMLLPATTSAPAPPNTS